MRFSFLRECRFDSCYGHFIGLVVELADTAGLRPASQFESAGSSPVRPIVRKMENMKDNEWAGSVKVGRYAKIPFDAPLRVDISTWLDYSIKTAIDIGVPDELIRDIAMAGLIRASQTYDKEKSSFVHWLIQNIESELKQEYRAQKRRQKDTFRELDLNRFKSKDPIDIDAKYAVQEIIKRADLTSKELNTIHYLFRIHGNPTHINLGIASGMSRQWVSNHYSSAMKKLQQVASELEDLMAPANAFAVLGLQRTAESATAPSPHRNLKAPAEDSNAPIQRQHAASLPRAVFSPCSHLQEGDRDSRSAVGRMGRHRRTDLQRL